MTFNIHVPNIIIYPFSRAIINEAQVVPGYEKVPVPVINVLLEYGNKMVVSL